MWLLVTNLDFIVVLIDIANQKAQRSKETVALQATEGLIKERFVCCELSVNDDYLQLGAIPEQKLCLG